MALPSIMADSNSISLSMKSEEKPLVMSAAIMDGKAIEHHLEPSYYKALCYAADNHNKDDDDDVDVDDEILEFSIEEPGSKGEE